MPGLPRKATVRGRLLPPRRRFLTLAPARRLWDLGADDGRMTCRKHAGLHVLGPLALRNRPLVPAERSAARLAHQSGGLGVPSSNLGAPTNSKSETVKPQRRRFLRLLAGAVAFPAVGARAQVYPSRPVPLIVGFAAGGAADVVARLMGQWLSERLGQSFIIENRPAPAAIWPPRRSRRRLPTAVPFCT
jgi:hypothetical protein